MRVVREGERGQALVETAISIGAFMAVLFAVIWVAQTAVIKGRLQLGVRYGAAVTSEINPYVDYSLYAVYKSVANPALPSYSCTAPPVGILAQTAPLTGPRSPAFWQPPVASISSSCRTTFGTYSGYAFVRPFLIEQTAQTFSAVQPAPSYLHAALGASSSLSATARYFRTPDIATVSYCFPDVSTAVRRSLAHDDASVAAEPAPTPIPAIPPSVQVPLSAACQ